ncbi:type VI secretion system tip protein TssI/VgrG [Pseudomonas sp. MDT1-17]
MFNPANQPHFRLTIDGYDHDFQVLAFSGQEAISSPYFFNVELVSGRSDIDLKSLTDKPAYLAFGTKGDGIHGRIYHVVQGGVDQQFTRYSVALVPDLAYLRHRVSTKVYQWLSVPEIVALTLEEHGILSDAYRFQLNSIYAEREHCEQYGESDLHFIQRLCEEEGIHYHFQHSAQGHALVFGDEQPVFPKMGQPTPYRPESDPASDKPLIKRFTLQLKTLTHCVFRHTYNSEPPRLPEGASSHREKSAGHEDALMRFIGPESGKQINLHTLERRHAAYCQAEGQSNHSQLVSGHVLEISGHPRQELNDLWLLTKVFHEGKQAPIWSGNATIGSTDNEDGFHHGYRNCFIARPWELFYHPPRVHKKPSGPRD